VNALYEHAQKDGGMFGLDVCNDCQSAFKHKHIYSASRLSWPGRKQIEAIFPFADILIYI
jgi:hypothetical protein